MAVLTSTHNLCFRAKITRKNVYPCKPQFQYIKVGCKGYSLHGLVIMMYSSTREPNYSFERKWDAIKIGRHKMGRNAVLSN